MTSTCNKWPNLPVYVIYAWSTFVLCHIAQKMPTQLCSSNIHSFEQNQYASSHGLSTSAMEFTRCHGISQSMYLYRQLVSQLGQLSLSSIDLTDNHVDWCPALLYRHDMMMVILMTWLSRLQKHACNGHHLNWSVVSSIVSSAETGKLVSNKQTSVSILTVLSYIEINTDKARTR